MEKFGLQRNRSSQLNFIENEIVKEQASALGRAGRKLSLSIEDYNKECDHNPDPDKLSRLINDISNSVWELAVQREFVGFIEGNLSWIKKNYVLPEEAIRALGGSD